MLVLVWVLVIVWVQMVSLVLLPYVALLTSFRLVLFSLLLTPRMFHEKVIALRSASNSNQALFVDPCCRYHTVW